jgi:hypothetical protein
MSVQRRRETVGYNRRQIINGGVAATGALAGEGGNGGQALYRVYDRMTKQA